MKRFLSLLASAACTFGVIAADSLFSADFTTLDADSFSKWTVIDANADETTWKFDDSATTSHVFYSYHISNNGDDWLISPAINIPADGTYVLSYEFSGSSYGEAFEVWTGSTPDIEGMTSKIAEHHSIGSEPTGNLAFADLKAGTMYFAFHCTSDANKFRLYLKSAQLMEASKPIDLRVNAIVNPVDGEGLGQETVTVEVSNLGRMDVDSYDIAYSLNGGEPVIEHVSETIAIGETKEYTFATKADLSIGHFTHTIKAWTIHPDDLNPANDSFEAKIKHIAPAAIPYRMGFEPDEDTSLFTFLNLNEDDGDWSVGVGAGWFGNFARTGFGYLGYNYNKENAADDWAFLEPIEMEAGHYVLKFWYSGTENHTERMRVFYGNAPTPEAMTNLLAEYDAVTNEHYQEAIHIFEITEPGNVYIGFYCYSDADENWLVIDDLSIDKIDPTVSDIILGNMITPTDIIRTGSLTDISFELNNVGIVDTSVTVNAYLDGEAVATTTKEIRGQEIITVVMENALEGISTGSHTVKIEALCENDTDTSNNVCEKEVNVMGEAVYLWDFEDGQIPEDITLRKEDSATDHPDAGEEFNENGFGIFNLQHFLLGNHALAVNTWFTDDSTADRWIVLPQMEVLGENTFFVWNANSYNPKFPEKYDVCVSKTTDNYSAYTTIKSISSEDASPQTRGVSLSDYAGEKVYIALHVRTSGGEAIILDNLGLYGEIRLESIGVDTVGNETFHAVIEGDMLNVYGAENATIEIYGLDGTMTACTAGTSADLSGLGNGVYVARVITEDSSATIKFAR